MLNFCTCHFEWICVFRMEWIWFSWLIQFVFGVVPQKRHVCCRRVDLEVGYTEVEQSMLGFLCERGNVWGRCERLVFYGHISHHNPSNLFPFLIHFQLVCINWTISNCCTNLLQPFLLLQTQCCICLQECIITFSDPFCLSFITKRYGRKTNLE